MSNDLTKPAYLPAPTTPGWYECRCINEPDHSWRGVLWWDGRRLRRTPTATCAGESAEDYTDFLRLVPASEPVAVERHREAVGIFEDAMASINTAYYCLHAVRKAGSMATAERYSFTNEADCKEVERAINELDNARTLLTEGFPAPAPTQSDRELADLKDASMLIRRLCYRLERMGADTIQERARRQIIEQATGWLVRKGLQGSPLRNEENHEPV